LVRLKGFKKLTSVGEALRTFLEASQIKKLRTVSVPLDSALGRVLAEPIKAKEDLPRIDRSAVDGYAVKAEDIIGASQSAPKILALADGNEIGSKMAKQVWTGNPVPRGANAVVMLENIERVNDKIRIWTQLTPGENVSRRGEDVKEGAVALKEGIRLKPQHLGLIAAMGMAEIKVLEKPKIAILVTGDELVEVGSKLRENEIFNTNGHMIAALCKELGAEPIDLGIAKDDIEELSERLTDGLCADMIVTTGGTSVGASDLVPEAVNRIGKPGVLVHGIAMRPGMPTALAVVRGKPVAVFPGNPVAAIIAFEVFVRPLILRMLGTPKEEQRLVMRVKMARKVATVLGRRTYVRVRVFQRGVKFLAEPVSARGSGIISTMTRSNGYVIVPENREGLAEGEAVFVHLFDNIEVVEGNV
jgi:molybdopterin molybdotransferase